MRLSTTNMPNRLASELSPYLLQHVDNPVGWYPWGEEAFARARDEDRPIFLSIGYSTCHWCHVMEHESFESDEIAGILNTHFVPIKVDREERPDVDRVYMAFVQATTGSGGWPMSVWLTPDLKPFFGGTYFPPASRSGRPGFLEILREIARRWRESRAELTESANGVFERLRDAQESRRGGGGGQLPDATLLAAGVGEYAEAFDKEHGGFGTAPKFPRPAELLFLLREFARTGDVEARHMVLETLRAMALGGMRDHLGGGFHRYSVDAAWRVPHFEKMLYDQAQLAIAYLETAQVAGELSFAAVAEDTLAYVQRDLRHPDGGFFSAEDADSVPPAQANDPNAKKYEGAFYVWSLAEIQQLFGDDAEIVRLRYGLEPTGNAPQDPHGEFVNQNLLYAARAVDHVAKVAGRSVESVAGVLERARAPLFERREQRPRPHLDDKVLAGWNGLMIAAFARAVRVLPSSSNAPSLLETATMAATFLWDRLWDLEREVLRRRFRDGRADIEGYAEDYAYVIWGLLELFQAGGDPRWLDWARRLQRRQDQLFWDTEDGGWFATTGEDPAVLLRLKEDYDGAEPSAGSVSVGNLITLSQLTTGDEARAHHERIERTLRRVPASAQLVRVVPLMMAAASTYCTDTAQVIVVGPRRDPGTVALQQVIAERFLPGTLCLVVEPGEHQQAVGERLPWVAGMKMKGGAPTAHVCREFACQTPVTAADALRLQLDALSTARR